MITNHLLAGMILQVVAKGPLSLFRGLRCVTGRGEGWWNEWGTNGG